MGRANAASACAPDDTGRAEDEDVMRRAAALHNIQTRPSNNTHAGRPRSRARVGSARYRHTAHHRHSAIESASRWHQNGLRLQR
eukprot:98181-Prymnesium_polylepis.2